MRQGYLLKTNHIRQTHHLPQLKSKKPKSYLPTSADVSNVLDEKALVLEIKDIDAALHSHQFSYYSGNLFSSLVSDKAINELHSALTKQGMILQSGYNFLDGGHVVTGKVKATNRIETFNEKMGNLSMKNVYDYDLNKYHMLMKNNRNRWSLFKREQRIVTEENESSVDTPIDRRTGTAKSGLNMANLQRKYDIITHKNYSSNRKRSEMSTQEKNTPLSYSKADPSQATTQLAQLINPTRFKDRNKPKQTHLYRKQVLTEVSELDSPEDNGDNLKISKFQVKNLLKREGNKLIILWLPPASYPHFNGLFTYNVSKSLTVCKLKKYFFFQRSLNDRLFNAILEHLSHLQNRYIEALQLLACKQDFGKIFQPLGWVMKSMQGMDKLRIKFHRKKS